MKPEVIARASSWVYRQQRFVISSSWMSGFSTILQQLAEASAFTKPFTPTVHVLVLPSRLPLDLRLNLRELDDTELASNIKFFHV